MRKQGFGYGDLNSYHGSIPKYLLHRKKVPLLKCDHMRESETDLNTNNDMVQATFQKHSSLSPSVSEQFPWRCVNVFWVVRQVGELSTWDAYAFFYFCLYMKVLTSIDIISIFLFKKIWILVKMKTPIVVFSHALCDSFKCLCSLGGWLDVSYLVSTWSASQRQTEEDGQII